MDLLVPILRHIAAAAVKGQFHVEPLIAGQRADVMLGVENLDVGVLLDVAGGDVVITGHVDHHGLGLLAVQHGNDALDVQNDLGHGGELMQNAVDLDARHGITGQRAEQNTAQGITEGNSVSPFQRLYDEGTLGTVVTEADSRNIGLFNLNHSK